VLTFEPSSRILQFTISIPDTFCGEKLEIPGSVADLRLQVSRRLAHSVLMSFPRDSHLSSYQICYFCCPCSVRGLFFHFSEQTLKRFREVMECDNPRKKWNEITIVLPKG
jgi:hypothetical protein